jgi:hypothetical protein
MNKNIRLMNKKLLLEKYIKVAVRKALAEQEAKEPSLVKGLYELLDAIVADWGKEDLYYDVKDVVVAYINPDDVAASKEAIKKIKDVLKNYDVLEDYAELVNGIAVKEPGTGLRPGVDLGSSFDKFKASLKEKLKADAKVK